MRRAHVADRAVVAVLALRAPRGIRGRLTLQRSRVGDTSRDEIPVEDFFIEVHPEAWSIRDIEVPGAYRKLFTDQFMIEWCIRLTELLKERVR